MSRASIFLLVLLAAVPLAAQESASAVAQAIAQGDLYQSKKKFDLALDAYHKADKLSHHTSALCYLKIASVERKLGDFSSALDNAKHAVKAAGEDKTLAIQAHLVRATLLTQMSGKPTDKKLKEAEAEIRQALALDPAQPLAHFDLGVVLLKQERDAEGLAELNAFVSSPGGNAATVAKARRFIASPIRAREPFAPDFSFVTHENKVVSNAFATCKRNSPARTSNWSASAPTGTRTSGAPSSRPNTWTGPSTSIYPEPSKRPSALIPSPLTSSSTRTASSASGSLALGCPPRRIWKTRSAKP
jgi:tetratricopeptide (TPR) repeat protein